MDNEANLVIETRNRVRLLRLNRPDVANALSPDLSRALIDAFLDADRDPEVRAILLTGTGERAFCGGMDLRYRANKDSRGNSMPVPNRGRHRLLYEVVLETWKPTLAALNGTAAGGGFEIAMACDLRLAASHADMVLPEARRGLSAHFATVMLPRLVPSAIAYELLYLGTPISAQRAHAVGLVNGVFPAEKLMEEATAMAETIAQNAPVTLRRMKETSVRASGLPLSAALRLNEGLSPYESEDRKEGIRAFIEKRPPEWHGR